eukprot:gene8557-1055_t
MPAHFAAEGVVVHPGAYRPPAPRRARFAGRALRAAGAVRRRADSPDGAVLRATAALDSDVLGHIDQGTTAMVDRVEGMRARLDGYDGWRCPRSEAAGLIVRGNFGALMDPGIVGRGAVCSGPAEPAAKGGESFDASQ